jgi:predicted secreted Zn-dependent protease
MKRAILLLLISIVGVEAYAQTIADIARRERERRNAAPIATPTNVPAVAPPAAVPIAPPTTPPAPVSAANPAPSKVVTLTATRATTAEDMRAEKDDVFRFYDVRGGSAADLRAELARLGPMSGGSRHQAVTNSKISWKPLPTPAPGGKCVVSAIELSLTIEIVMPRWVNEVGAPQGLSENWHNFLSGLLNHEHGHKQIALANAEEIRQLVKTMTPQATCDTATNAFNAAARAINDKAEAKQVAYDKATDHGRLQGVRMP